jgi:hypothetical protein
MVRRASLPESFDRAIYDSLLYDDFATYVDGQLWTAVTDFSVAMAGAGATIYKRGGILIAQTNNTDNNEAYVISTNALFGPRVGGTIGCACRFKIYDPGTNNFIFGFLEDAAADSLIDDGGGVLADKNVICVYKVDGETNFRCRSGWTTAVKQDHLSNQTANTSTSSGVAASTTDFVTLKIEAIGNGSEIEIFYSIDTKGFGAFQELRDANNQVIRHVQRADPADDNDMKLIVGCKTGADASAALHIDWIAGWAARSA